MVYSNKIISKNRSPSSTSLVSPGGESERFYLLGIIVGYEIKEYPLRDYLGTLRLGFPYTPS